MIAPDGLWTHGRVGAMLSPPTSATVEATRNLPT
jgi:hypothetical protein